MKMATLEPISSTKDLSKTDIENDKISLSTINKHN